MPITIDGTNGITQAGEFNSDSNFGFKNRIINGAMVIDQRNAGAEVNPAVNGTYYLDRWATTLTASGKFKIGQNAGSVTPPVGFTKYLGCTSLSAYSVTSSDAFVVYQRIEGQNMDDLAWGTANAKTVTLSFQVYSSLTGTFGGAIVNGAYNRSYPFTYTISSANTWTTISVTIVGDTSGTWATDNGSWGSVNFSLGAGSTFSGTAGAWAGANYASATGATSVVGTNGATFYITGVQLEKGSTATSFDYRPYGTELALCQRYCQIIAKDNEQAIPSGWYFSSSTELATDMRLTPPMRTVPTLTQTATAYRANSAGLNGNSTTAIVLGAIESTVNSARLSQAGYSGATAGQGAIVRIYNSGAGTYFGFTAEL
jgi:hypothetical protein